MKITKFQKSVLKALRPKGQLSIGHLVTDQQVFDAINHVLNNPHDLFPDGTDSTVFWVRVKLLRDFAAKLNELKKELS